MVKERGERQRAIRDIVRNEVIRTQRELARELRRIGFDCTQATVSRDAIDLGLCKLPDGTYALSEDQHLRRMVAEFVTEIERANNLVVIKTQPGTAPGVAAAIDDANLDRVVGSVAGNDTVLVISPDDGAATSLSGLFRDLHAEGRG